MAVLVSKPGLTSASTLSIPKDWSAAWFRSLIANQLVGADVRNAVGANGITISGTIASPYATIQPSSPFIVPTPAGGTARFAVGTTPRSWASGCPSIDLGNCGLMAYPSGADDLLYLTANLYWDGGSWRYVSTNPGCISVVNGSGGFTWNSAPSGASGSAATLLNTMVLDSSGNLSTAGSIIAGGNIQAIGGVYYGKGSDNAIEDAGDGWLRLNNVGSYANGVFTPYILRVDGAVYVGPSSYLKSIGSIGYSYGAMALAGSTGGYDGLALTDGQKVTFMSNGTDMGIYKQTSGAWIWYDDGTATHFVNEIVPSVDNHVSCGVSTNRWSVIYAATGTINTSDARLKTNVQPSNLGLSFINALKPVSYQWIEGGQTITKFIDADTPPQTQSVPGARTHYGLLAQDVKSTLNTMLPGGDFAGWTLADKNDPTSTQGLRYDQFIAPLIKAVQELSAQVAALQAKVR